MKKLFSVVLIFVLCTPIHSMERKHNAYAQYIKSKNQKKSQPKCLGDFNLLSSLRAWILIIQNAKNYLRQ